MKNYPACTELSVRIITFIVYFSEEGPGLGSRSDLGGG